ncbi:hypothetical protein BDQ17DRAFT_804331 [Cyathus striatus]|nr:hypothetical protein BDQ17DRAFT_804331 [Cyathus striatus]
MKQENKFRSGIAASAGLNWTRSIASTSTVLSHHSWRLSFFSNLQTLCINLSPEGLATQHSRMKHIFSGMEDISLSNTLTSLHMSFVPRIDMPLLSLISDRFSALTNLHITCTERLNMACCWICFEDS